MSGRPMSAWQPCIRYCPIAASGRQSRMPCATFAASASGASPRNSRYGVSIMLAPPRPARSLAFAARFSTAFRRKRTVAPARPLFRAGPPRHCRGEAREGDMGHLRDGVWHKGALATTSRDGEFRRKDSVCRNWITADGAPGPNGRARLPGRERPLPPLRLLRLPLGAPHADLPRAEGPRRRTSPSTSCTRSSATDGWTFDTDFPGATGDRLGRPALPARGLPRGRSRRHQPGHACRCSGTRRPARIVSNESAEIIRMLNSAFDGITGNTPRLLARGAARRDRRGERPRLRRASTTASTAPASPARQDAYDARGRRGLRHARLARGPARAAGAGWSATG